MKACEAPGCDAAKRQGRYCFRHYARLRRRGELEPNPLRVNGPAETRFWAKVDKNGPVSDRVPGRCWNWIARHYPKGYGKFRVDSRMWFAHRWAYEYLVGPIPEGMEIDHLCRNRRCVNPEHLQPVTGLVNQIRGDLHHRNKTHCPLGHPYDMAERRPDGGVARRCRTCRNEQARERRAVLR